MGGQNFNTDVDPEYLKKSEQFWTGFIKFSKLATVIIAAILLLMAAFLL